VIHGPCYFPLASFPSKKDTHISPNLSTGVNEPSCVDVSVRLYYLVYNFCHFGEEDGVDGFAEDEVVDMVVIGFFDR
jgi:hypothetical protein